MKLKEARKKLNVPKTYESLATYALILKDEELIEDFNNTSKSGDVDFYCTDQAFVYYGVAVDILMDDDIGEDIKSEIRDETIEYYNFVEERESTLKSIGIDPDPLETDAVWNQKLRNREGV